MADVPRYPAPDLWMVMPVLSKRDRREVGIIRDDPGRVGEDFTIRQTRFPRNGPISRSGYVVLIAGRAIRSDTGK